MHVLFDLQHVLYMAISAVVTVDLLLLAHIYVKKQEHKNLILLLSAIITIVLHYSDLYVDYFTNNGEASIGSNHILPVFACNVMMWLLFACSLIKNKDGFWFKVIAEYCFYAGVVCGIIGI